MKYVIWFVRFWYAAWMIPAGIEHFYHIYPQPGANSPHPLAAEMLSALLSTHLFDLVKGVELIAGLAVLFGFFTPAALLISMPVAFCVFWWDAPLSEWSTGSLIAGARVLGSNIIMSVAFFACFKPMFVGRAALAEGMQSRKSLFTGARLLLGAWMLLNALNHFFFSFWAMPAGETALSQQLMSALVHSQLLDVCMLIEGVAGALLLLGVWVPAALCTLMAVSTSALFWAVLDHQPLTLALGLLAFALNALLMLACLPHYQGALQRAPLSMGETDPRNSYNSLYVHAGGRTSRSHFLGALVPFALAAGWYLYQGPASPYSSWGILTILCAGVVLHVRRLHDMGRSGWWMFVPTVLTVAAMLIWANRLTLGAQLDAALPIAALATFVAAALWGAIGRGQAESNTFGAPVAA